MFKGKAESFLHLGGNNPRSQHSWELTDWEQLCQAGPVGLVDNKLPGASNAPSQQKKTTPAASQE